MLSGLWRGATGASPRNACRHRLRVFLGVIAVSILGLAAAGCNISSERLGPSLGPLAAGRSAIIAIESIDGPPPAVTRNLTARLSEEAEARQLAVVLGGEPANYRVRGYLSTHVERGKTSIAWVWDIYGADKRRVLRISGEEPSGENTRDHARDSWAGVDDRVLRRIAQSGMDRILVFLNSSGPEPLVSSPDAASFTTIPAHHSPPS